MLNNIKIGKKLGIGFGICIVVMLIICVSLIINFYVNKTKLDYIDNKTISCLEAANTVSSRINELMRIFGIMPFLTKEEYIKEKQKVPALREEYAKALKAIDTLEDTDEGKKMIQNIKDRIKPAAAKNNQIMQLIEEGKNEEAQRLYIQESKEPVNEILKLVDQYVNFQKEKVDREITILNQTNIYLIIISLTISIIAILISLIFAFKISKNIKEPVIEITRYLKNIANGDFTTDIELEKRQDELGEAVAAIGELKKNLISTVMSIVGGIHSLTSSATQLSAIAEQLSRTAESTTQRANSVATASEEMSQTVIDIAKNSASIAESAGKSLKVAKEGDSVVDLSVKEIKQIEKIVNETSQFVESLGQKSTQIGQIINTINDIADQTNLLALNAAIEAARAGEQGRGFAVVADEVRKLAERTAHATAEISEMINSIQKEVSKAVTLMKDTTKRVESGVDLTVSAGEALKNIVKNSEELQLMIQQIATATEEMSATAEQISKEITDISNSTRETSQSSQETAQAAIALSNLGTSLQKTMDFFKLERS